MIKKTADWIYKHFGTLLVSEKVKKRLGMLHPGVRAEETVNAYYINKLSLLWKILLSGTAVSVALTIKILLSVQTEDGILLRNEYGKGSKTYEMTLFREDGYSADRKVEVMERQYTEEESVRLYEEMLPVLEQIVLQENVSWDRVTGPLSLPENMTGYPFSITWSSRPDILDKNGTLKEVPVSGTEIEITALITHTGFQRSQTWNAHVYTQENSEKHKEQEEQWMKALEEALEVSGLQSAAEESWRLPDMVEGKKISWREKREHTGFKVMGLTILASLAVYFLKDRDLEQQVRSRDRQFQAQYSMLVNKLVLYMGAGMTVRAAWQKTAVTGKGVYQEMAHTCKEMESGVPETVCYERFGKRCGQPAFIKLGALLAQNIKKGNRHLLVQLKKEAENAMEERRHMLKRAGEEAGTKLLGPMMLMLGVVLLLIMVPAFSGLGV